MATNSQHKGRRLIANLDAESTWARHLQPDLPRRPLSSAARLASERAADGMRAVGTADDELLLSEPDEPLPTDLPWAATGAGHGEPIDPWWPSGVPSIDVAARVNHRAWGLDIARRLDCALAGSTMIESIEALDQHLAQFGSDRAWVVKAPLSAAGRHRVIHRPGNSDGAGEQDRELLDQRVGGLLQRHGPLLFQPWLDRVDDLAIVGIVQRPTTEDDTVQILGIHRLLVDTEGRFHGVDSATTASPSIDREHIERLYVTAHRVGRELARTGYHGPFGIDACRYRPDAAEGDSDQDGAVELQPILEINARMTFGHLFWAEFG